MTGTATAPTACAVRRGGGYFVKNGLTHRGRGPTFAYGDPGDTVLRRPVAA